MRGQQNEGTVLRWPNSDFQSLQFQTCPRGGAQPHGGRHGGLLPCQAPLLSPQGIGEGGEQLQPPQPLLSTELGISAFTRLSQERSQFQGSGRSRPSLSSSPHHPPHHSPTTQPIHPLPPGAEPDAQAELRCSTTHGRVRTRDRGTATRESPGGLSFA